MRLHAEKLDTRGELSAGAMPQGQGFLARVQKFLKAPREGQSLLGRLLTQTVTAASECPRPVRRRLAMAMDALLCIVSVWIAWSLRLGGWDLFGPGQLLLIAVSLALWLPIAMLRRTYASLIRYSGGRTMLGLAVTCAYFAVPMSAIFMVWGIIGVPRTMGLLHPIIFFLLLCISRMVVRFVLVEALQVAQLSAPRRNVCIYGVGDAGKQLALALRHEPRVRLLAFVDDDARLADELIDGVPVFSARKIGQLVDDRLISEVYLAIPQASRSRRREIVEMLTKFNVQVRTLPTVGSMIDGQVTLSDLREVEVEELLGRDPVPPREDLLRANVAGQVVMVSGAGGSIGSELVRQIVAIGPSRLVLLEMSEFGLYAVEREAREIARRANVRLEIVPELASVAERESIQRIMAKYRPQTVFHAAAYKHVPMLEANPLAAIKNNIIGTLNLARAARSQRVEKFILVSTDKAVRPTNIMGASKRICELTLQAFSEEKGETCFSMVRFGNVLGSSGSVVPLFRRQIKEGGPVTLTHPEVTRYFMTIPEAASLVIQAAAMARGGEVFVLDMGQSVRIIDLARSMISLSGLTVRDADNPDGDIEIREIGLRPGEKLYEELLIGNSPEATEHARIMRAREGMIPWPVLEEAILSLEDDLRTGDARHAVATVRRLVPDFLASEESAADSLTMAKAL